MQISIPPSLPPTSSPPPPSLSPHPCLQGYESRLRTMQRLVWEQTQACEAVHQEIIFSIANTAGSVFANQAMVDSTVGKVAQASAIG